MNRTLTLALLLVGCTAVEPRSWSFVQSVGGIRVDEPLISEIGGWALPVLANVSGLQAITVKPTTLNSGLVCDTGAVVEGTSIYVTVSTALPGGTRTAECPYVQLGKLPKGSYSVFYRGPGEQPVALGEIKIGL